MSIDSEPDEDSSGFPAIVRNLEDELEDEELNENDPQADRLHLFAKGGLTGSATWALTAAKDAKRAKTVEVNFIINL